MPSAGVIKKEIDLSLYVETASDLVLGMVHVFNKGPIGEKTLVSNPADLESLFGKPIDDAILCQGFFSAREFLRRANQAWIVRADSAANPAVASKAGIRGASDDTLTTGADGATSIPATRQLTSALSTFQTDGVLAGDTLEISSGVDAGWYIIASVDSETQITVSADFPTGSDTGASFSVWSSKRVGAADGATSVAASRSFTSATGNFINLGVQAGDILYINDTGDEEDNGYYVVASVSNATTLVLNRDFPAGELTALTYTVYGAQHPAGADGVTTADGEFASASATFQSHGVKAGDLLIVEDADDTGDNGVFVITGLKTAAEETTLEVNLGEWADGSLTGLSYRVVPGVLTLDAESKGSGYDGWSIETKANAANSTLFDVNVYDENSFLVESFAGLSISTIVAGMEASSFFPTATLVVGRAGPAIEYIASSNGGVDGTEGLTDSDLITALNEFANIEEVELDVLIIPGYTSQNVGDALINMASVTRGDCMAIPDHPDDPTISSAQEAVDWANGQGSLGRTAAINTSFAGVYSSWGKIYDEYNEVDRWLAPSGTAAAVWAQSDNQAYPWIAPAGLRRGTISSLQDLRFSPTKGERDYLQDFGNINPIVKFVRDGIVAFGQKTMLRTNSSLNRINVRRMLLYIERRATQAVRGVVFEPNDNATDREIIRLLTPICTFVRDNRGLNDFLILVDDTTSPAAVRQANKIIGKIFLQPTPTAEIIELQFILTPQTISFAELIAA